MRMACCAERFFRKNYLPATGRFLQSIALFSLKKFIVSTKLSGYALIVKPIPGLFPCFLPVATKRRSGLPPGPHRHPRDASAVNGLLTAMPSDLFIKEYLA
jgi:hypothetical protein